MEIPHDQIHHPDRAQHPAEPADVPADPETGGPSTLALISDARHAPAEPWTLPANRKAMEAAAASAGPNDHYEIAVIRQANAIIAGYAAQGYDLTLRQLYYQFVSRYLTRHGVVVPTPAKRPKSSYTRFQADLPNECWQADFNQYGLTCPDGKPGADVEFLTWLDDCSRYALRVTAHPAVTGPLVVASFRQAVAEHGVPSSTLTDSGMVFTTRLSGGKGGRNGLEAELRRLNVHQKNSSPNHPTTCGKVERFQQTMKRWLRAQPQQPTTLDQLQTMLCAFVQLYNQQRPHRSLPHRAAPAAVCHTRSKAVPLVSRELDHHCRIRHDVIDATGKVTLRVAGRLLHIGVGRTHARTPVVLLVQDLNVRVVDAVTGELLRALTLDPSKSYQPTGRRPGSRLDS